LYVNGEKFDFSTEVMTLGRDLFQSFLELHKKLRKVFLSANYEG